MEPVGNVDRRVPAAEIGRDPGAVVGRSPEAEMDRSYRAVKGVDCETGEE